MIRDRNVDWKTGRTYIGWKDLTGTIGCTGGTVFVWLDAGAVVAQEISTTNLGAPLMEAADDQLSHNMVVPQEWDPNYPLKFSVNWTHGSSTTGDSVTWLVLCDFKAENVALAAASTALDTVIADDNVVTQWGNQWTPQGIKNANWLTRAQVDSGRYQMVLSIEAAVLTDITEDIHFLGLEIEFTRRMTKS